MRVLQSLFALSLQLQYNLMLVEILFTEIGPQNTAGTKMAYRDLDPKSAPEATNIIFPYMSKWMLEMWMLEM